MQPDIVAGIGALVANVVAHKIGAIAIAIYAVAGIGIVGGVASVAL